MISNPFAADVYPDGMPAFSGVSQVHAEAMQRLQGMVGNVGGRLEARVPEGGGGTVVLLRAPRAGFGKSHLLGRLSGELGDAAFVIPVPFDREREVQWSALLWRVIEAIHSSKFRDLTLLDFVTRRIFAMVNERMITARQVPCANPKEALTALETRFLDLFDFSNAAQPVARWFADHFERLLPFASSAVGEFAGLAAGPAGHWLRVLCSYAQGRPEGDTARWEALRWSVMQPSGPAIPHAGMTLVSAGTTGESGARERLVEFCWLAAAVRPLVLVYDELDLFHQELEPVRRIAGFIAELRRLLPRAVQVLSVNQDLWSETFLKAVPSAIEDRLTGNQITLGTLSREDAAPLIRARLTHSGLSDVVVTAFLNRLNLSAYFSQEAGRLVSPRAVLRHAAQAWEEFERSAREHPAVNGFTTPVPDIAEIPAGRQEVPAPPPFIVLPPELDEETYIAAPTKPGAEPARDPFVEAVAPGDPAFARLRETLQRLLTPLPPEEPPYTPPPFITNIPPSIPPPATVTGHLTGNQSVIARGRSITPAAPAASGSAILPRRFQQLRAHFLTAPWLSVDQDRLFHLLKMAGRRLAVIRWVDHPLPGSPGQSAGAWLGPDGETIFGSEPYEDRTYWSSLVHFTRERSGHGFTARARSSAPCRLVVFSATKAPVNLAAWMPQDEIIDARTHFLDVQPVDQPLLATLYAADELMRDAERGSLGVSPDDTFAMLVPHVEFLWKQMTRPQKV